MWRALVLCSLVSRVLLHSSKPVIYLRTKDFLSWERQNVYLVVALVESGNLQLPPKDCVSAFRLLRAKVFFKTVWLGNKRPEYAVTITDIPGFELGLDTVLISKKYFTDPPGERRIFLPYFAHPRFYEIGLHKRVKALRNKIRIKKIYFAGSCSRETYAEKFEFPMLTRDVVLDFIIRRYVSEIKDGLIDIQSTSDTRDVLDKFKLSTEEYLNELSTTDFFVCPPGNTMPHSHNIVEAMSVGAIPITNYSAYMRPPLVHGENCLAFSSLQGLESVICTALNMQKSEVQQMRANVCAYYDKNLDPASFGIKLRRRINEVDEIVVNDEAESVKDFVRSRRIS